MAHLASGQGIQTELGVDTNVGLNTTLSGYARLRGGSLGTATLGSIGSYLNSTVSPTWHQLQPGTTTSNQELQQKYGSLQNSGCTHTHTSPIAYPVNGGLTAWYEELNEVVKPTVVRPTIVIETICLIRDLCAHKKHLADADIEIEESGDGYLLQVYSPLALLKAVIPFKSSVKEIERILRDLQESIEENIEEEDPDKL